MLFLVFLFFWVLFFLVFLVFWFWFFDFGVFVFFGFGVFGIFGFGFFGCVKGKGLLCFRVLITAAPLSVRVDSDVVEEACLNCPKRSGRV